MTFDPARVRIDRLFEALQVIKVPPATFSGQHYRVNGLDSFPKPVQQPHPPILVGAGGRRMLEVAALEADIVAIMAAPITTGTITDDPRSRLEASFAERVGWVREAAGDRFQKIELSLVASLLPSDHRSQAAETLAHTRGWDTFATHDVLAMPQFLIGASAQMADDLHSARQTAVHHPGVNCVLVPSRGRRLPRPQEWPVTRSQLSAGEQPGGHVVMLRLRVIIHMWQFSAEVVR